MMIIYGLPKASWRGEAGDLDIPPGDMAACCSTLRISRSSAFASCGIHREGHVMLMIILIV
jgi:hypothetical protein